jgi:hypothetical protein
MKSGFADPASPFQPKTAFLHSLDPGRTLIKSDTFGSLLGHLFK